MHRGGSKSVSFLFQLVDCRYVKAVVAVLEWNDRKMECLGTRSSVARHFISSTQTRYPFDHFFESLSQIIEGSQWATILLRIDRVWRPASISSDHFEARIHHPRFWHITCQLLGLYVLASHLLQGFRGLHDHQGEIICYDYLSPGWLFYRAQHKQQRPLCSACVTRAQVQKNSI